MMKRVWLVLSIVMLLLVGCAPTATESSTNSDDENLRLGTPKMIIGWSGSGMKNTQSFGIGSPWSLQWTFTPGSPGNGNYLGITVVRSGDELPVSVAANESNMEHTTTHTAYIYQSGTFYLAINSFGGEWDIHIIAYSR
jgi:hypothetical protein